MKPDSNYSIPLSSENIRFLTAGRMFLFGMLFSIGWSAGDVVIWMATTLSAAAGIAAVMEPVIFP